MADETLTVDTEVIADSVTTPPTAGETQQEPVAQERKFTQADLDRILTERLAKASAKADAQAAKVQAEAERKAAEEQGKYQELYEKAQAELAAKDAQIKANAIAIIKRDVATRLGMPAALAARLRGEDEDSIEQDAKDLMAALPKPSAPNINSAAGTASGKSLPAGFNEQDLRDQAVRLGVNPDTYVQQFMRS
jgi:hypothetical protein